ncbi:MAG: hypothetical protein QGI73_00895 [Candidatus Thalassarchaeaceae archaeon]|jgi:hypothetical protein|nr:hypothetical protein [Euryarchaeota archaeon]MDP6870777.1 hypothetical protein [Candidatus Thalassarchaeaceae archaeon]|tara:strand:+ start:3415 stop:4398 length:984 start_codon:yes stop_codon:yes gene_type:complete
MDYDMYVLDTLYRGRLVELRERAEELGISKSGSVEVIRARLIHHLVLPDLDLSWDGIQSMSHKDLGEVLKIFGVKSSGSQRERRQRLWLHLNFDSRRMTIEKLAEMDRDDLHEMCVRLESPLTGNRTILMGRVAGVLTNQLNGWGRIKRSLRRNGIPDAVEQRGDQYTRDESVSAEEYPLEIDSNFHDIPPQAVLEDAADAIILGAERLDQGVQTDLKFVVSKISDLERMVGTILRGHGGRWGEAQKELILRLAIRRGWPVEDDAVRTRMSRVATDMAEIKGARLGEFGMEQSRNTLREEVVSSTSRTRIKETMRGAQRVLERPDSN